MVDYVDKDCVLITDAYKAYNGLGKDYTHITVKHTEGNYKTDSHIILITSKTFGAFLSVT